MDKCCGVREEFYEACYGQTGLEARRVFEDALQWMRKTVYRGHIETACDDLIVRGLADGTRPCAVIGNRQSVETECPCLDRGK